MYFGESTGSSNFAVMIPGSNPFHKTDFDMFSGGCLSADVSAVSTTSGGSAKNVLEEYPTAGVTP